MAIIKCSNCEKELNSDAKFCPNCGCKIKKDNNVLDIIFIILLIIYSIFAIYALYQNISGFLEFSNLYSYTITIADYMYYADNIIYYIGTALSLWGIFAYNKTNNSSFGILSGIMLIVSIFVFFIYTISYLICYEDISIINICIILINRYIIIGILYLLAIKMNNLIKN